MDGISIILVVVLFLAIWITIIALFHIIRTDIYDKKQKVIQCLLVFALPVIFSIVTLSIIFNHYRQDPYSKNPVRVGFFLVDLIVLSAFTSNISHSSATNIDQSVDVGASKDNIGGLD